MRHGGGQRQPRASEVDGDVVAVALDAAQGHVHRRRADEPGDEDVVRVVVQELRRADLLQHTVLHQRDPVAHRHRLDLVVGDVDRGDVEVVLHLGDLGAHLHPQLGVQVGQWLVHEEHLRLADDRPAHRDPLPLAAGELLGPAVQQRAELEHVGGLLHPAVDLRLVHAADPQPVGDVVGDRHVRVEGVRLEHHRDVAVARGQRVDHPVADGQRAAGDVLQAGDHAQRRALAAAGRPDEHEELAVLDVAGRGL